MQRNFGKYFNLLQIGLIMKWYSWLLILVAIVFISGCTTTQQSSNLTTSPLTTTTSQSFGTQTIEANVKTYGIPYVLNFGINTIYFPTNVRGLINESNIGEPINSFLYQGWKIQYQDYPEMQTTNQKIELQSINGLYQESILNPISIHPATSDFVAGGRQIFLNLLNNERARYNISLMEPDNNSYSYNLPTLSLDDSNLAQNRANDMIERNYFSHITPPPFLQNWNYSSPPNLLYTQSGGQDYFEENILERYCPGNQACISLVNQSDLQNYLNDDLYSFIYEDNSSNWGHRDSLLNPCFNYVSVGMNWTDSQYRLVAHMEGKWIKWETSPTFDNGLFTASGYIDNKFSIDPNQDVQIFFSTPSQINQMTHSYSVGNFYAGLTTPGYVYNYPYANTIYPGTFTYDKSTGKFNLEFRFNRDNTGVYTIVMFATDKYRILHPTIPYLGYTCKIFEYSIPNVVQ